jgi:hypothetical protein
MSIEYKEKDINFSPVFKRLQEITLSVKDDKVEFSAFDYDILLWVVLELIKFDINLPFEHKYHCLSKSLTKIVIDQKFDKDYLIELLKANTNSLLKNKEEIFLMACELSITGFNIDELVFDGSEISFLNEFPESIQIARNEKTSMNEPNTSKVLVRVKAKDYLSAQNIAFQSLEVIRAMLNLLFNHEFSRKIGYKTTEPINRIRFLQHITLHSIDGKLINNNAVWQIINYEKPKIVEFEKDLGIEDFLKINIQKLKECNPGHKESLESVLTYYARAYDESNPDLTFVNSWRILEILTSTDKNDILIKRISTLYKKEIRGWVTLNLKALRNYRNEFIHVGPRELDSDTACYLIQDIIKKLVFNFNLKNSGIFRSMEDAAFYLDKLSIQDNDFEKQFEIIRKVKEHRKKNS